MKNLRFDELLLVSQVERRARRVPLHRTATVIRGANDTGKSSVLKSLYRTLGADPPNIHPRWEDAEVISSLRFAVDDVPYRMLRFKSRFTLFDGEDDLIASFTSVTKELAPHFADLFSFHLQLRSGDEDKQATPAFLFLPFYIDQDQGWQQNLNSFARLGQFRQWKPDVVSFHAGIRPSDYYLAKSRLNELDQRANAHRQKRDDIKSLLDDVLARLGKLDFDVDIQVFSRELKLLLERIASLQSEERKLRRRLTDAFNLKRGVEEQIEIVGAALHELREDRQYATELTGESVICPTCHAIYENGFAERFAIALDEDACLQLLSELQEQQAVANKKWENLQRSTSAASEAAAGMQRLLTTKRKKVALQDVLRREGQKEVSEVLRAQVDELNSALGTLDEEHAEATRDMNKYSNPKRRKEISGYYLQQIQRLLERLSVVDIPERTYKRIDAVIKETGSDLPRAILAYYFALNRTIHTYSSSTFCPIVIDSPRQQEQDEPNLERILACIREEKPKGSQLVLALVDDMGVDFGGTVIDLTDERQVLQRKRFVEAMEELRPLIDASLDV